MAEGTRYYTGEKAEKTTDRERCKRMCRNRMYIWAGNISTGSKAGGDVMCSIKQLGQKNM